MWKRYVEYLKDNPHQYWFKRKVFGWGWTPARWQGWLCLLVFLALVFLNVWRLENLQMSEKRAAIEIVVENSVLVGLLIYIAYKTGEKPKWQWGLPKKK